MADVSAALPRPYAHILVHGKSSAQLHAGLGVCVCARYRPLHLIRLTSALIWQDCVGTLWQRTDLVAAGRGMCVCSKGWNTAERWHAGSATVGWVSAVTLELQLPVSSSSLREIFISSSPWRRVKACVSVSTRRSALFPGSCAHAQTGITRVCLYVERVCN